MSSGHGGVLGSLPELRKQGWIRQIKPGQWALTPEGLVEAKKLSLKETQ
jgi:hypothetical protein